MKSVIASIISFTSIFKQKETPEAYLELYQTCTNKIFPKIV